jgi:hypothetical protein
MLVLVMVLLFTSQRTYPSTRRIGTSLEISNVNTASKATSAIDKSPGYELAMHESLTLRMARLWLLPAVAGQPEQEVHACCTERPRCGCSHNTAFQQVAPNA